MGGRLTSAGLLDGRRGRAGATEPADVAAPAPTVLPPPDHGPRPVSLRDVLETLGPHALRLVAGPSERLAEPLGEPLVHGPGEPLTDVGDRVVLLTGARAGIAETLASLHQVVAAGGRTAVLKAWGQDLTAAAATATGAGLVLLCTPDEMPWRHLDASLTAARLTGPPPADDPRGPGDLFSLANAIAASLGGPVTIEETSGRVLAHSNLPGQEVDDIRRRAILGRQTPERPGNAAEYQAVLQAEGPVLFQSSHPDLASRMAVAVRAGHQTLGVIFVLCDRPQLVDDADRVLLDAARTTALHLLRRRGSADPHRARRSEALRGLLAGALDAPTAAAALGLPPATSTVLAVVRPVPGAGLRPAEAARVADLVALHGEYWHAAAASVLDGGDLLLLLPVPGAPADDRRGQQQLGARLRALGTDLAAAAQRSAGVELLVGFGPVVPAPADVPRARALADRVLGVLEETGRGVATLDDVRSAVVLAALRTGRPTDDDELQLPQVRAVLAHDAAQGTDYARTLLTHLSTFGNVPATAAALNVHENTARYRVRRLTDGFGIALDAGDDTLVAWLQLRSALGGPG